MKPQILLLAQIGDAAQIVNRADIHRAGRSNNQKWPQSRRTVLRHHHAKRSHAHAERNVDWNQPQRV